MPAHRFRRRTSARLGLPAGLALASAMALASAAVTAVPAQAVPHPEVTVMTQNLYLGSSLDPATDIDPEDPNAAALFVGAVAQIFATTVFTDFPTRARAIASEVADAEPDLIGLQEVSHWTAAGVGNSAATPPSYDFLEILLDALEAEGLDYSVAGVSDNANIGPVPLVAPGAGCVTPAPVPDCVVTFADRDVILVNDDTPGLTVAGATSGTYATQQIVPTPAGPLSFDRGWVAVQGRYQGKSFRMVNTHLETETYPAVQQAQAREFLRGPAKGGAVIATGDFNSAADGTTTTSYAQLTAPPAFVDAWSVNALSGNPGDPGLTCCQNSTLTNPTSQVGSRIDLVLGRGPVRPVAAEVVGDQPFRTQTSPTPRPIWPSDHAGVVATLRLR